VFYENIQLEYVRIHVIHRVHEAEYGIHILVVAPQEYVNSDSTRRLLAQLDRSKRTRRAGAANGGALFQYTRKSLSRTHTPPPFSNLLPKRTVFFRAQRNPPELKMPCAPK